MSKDKASSIYLIYISFYWLYNISFLALHDIFINIVKKSIKLYSIFYDAENVTLRESRQRVIMMS